MMSVERQAKKREPPWRAGAAFPPSLDVEQEPRRGSDACFAAVE
jgi:hypothetical protein